MNNRKLIKKLLKEYSDIYNPTEDPDHHEHEEDPKIKDFIEEKDYIEELIIEAERYTGQSYHDLEDAVYGLQNHINIIENLLDTMYTVKKFQFPKF